MCFWKSWTKMGSIIRVFTLGSLFVVSLSLSFDFFPSSFFFFYVFIYLRLYWYCLLELIDLIDWVLVFNHAWRWLETVSQWRNFSVCLRQQWEKLEDGRKNFHASDSWILGVFFVFFCFLNFGISWNRVDSHGECGMVWLRTGVLWCEWGIKSRVGL